MGQKVLLFHIDPMKQVQIENVCKELGIEAVKVERKDYAQPLGRLAQIVGFAGKKEAYTGEELAGEMMILSGMPEKELDKFLDAYKKAGIAPVYLKAIVTPHNVKWTPEEIYRELMREHLSMRQ